MRLETLTELNLVEIDCELDFYNILFSDGQSGFPAETVVQKVPALQQYEAENNIWIYAKR